MAGRAHPLVENALSEIWEKVVSILGLLDQLTASQNGLDGAGGPSRRGATNWGREAGNFPVIQWRVP